MDDRVPSAGVVPERLVLFDGICGLCDWWVQWILARDARARLHYAPLQGETASAVLARNPDQPRDLSTVLYVVQEGDQERVYARSAAIFRIWLELDAPWRWAACLRWLPQGLCDVGYRLVARLRYALFGRLDACRIPAPDVAPRFLP